MSPSTLAWGCVLGYAAITLGFAVRGALRTKDVAAYAVGDRGVPAALVGLALTAQLTSVATFVINPGLVFHSGVSALLGYGAAAALGIITGLLLLSGRFRRVGDRTAALTLPQWIGARYDSAPLRALFVALSSGLLAYAVLIVVALALVLTGLLGVPASLLAVAIVVFAVSTVAMGGAVGHAWTGAIQALIMLVVAVVLISRGLPALLDGTLLASLDPTLRGVTNPNSFYFRSLFEVFVCNFVVGAALVCQPHILSKALYLRDDSQLRTYLTTAVLAGMVFLGVLLVGLYARAVVPAGTAIDQVVPTWIAASFSPGTRVLIALGLLCAGFSTLEGILLAIASIVSIDVHPALDRLGFGAKVDALLLGRLSLILVALVTAVMALQQLANPTGGTVAIFAQYGVYLLLCGTSVPLVCGMFLPRASRRLVSAAATTSLIVFLLGAVLKLTVYSNNPAVLATCGIFAGWMVTAVGLAFGAVKHRVVKSASKGTHLDPGDWRNASHRS